ncbi:MAG: RdgB/HAM1 family non-canonical purine NTP pyrophosphatase [Methyloceanibacter sp.]
MRRGTRLVIASHNEGKVREIADLLAPFGVEAVSAGKLGLPEPEETGASFAENAALKAVTAARSAGLPALADDSGLEVKALGGEPGIHSARGGGAARDFGLAMERVHRELEAAGAKDSAANFTCALALASPDGEVQVFEGKVFGMITWPPRGTRGFGYDPIFVPEGYSETFGEMEPSLKDSISHRARAFEKLMLAAYDHD